MTKKQLSERITEEEREKLLGWQCDPHLIQPDEISNVVLFLASSVSGAITGQNLLADRGWTHI